MGKMNFIENLSTSIGIASMPRANTIAVNFAGPTEWLYLSTDKARELAKLLVEKADELDGKGG